MLELNRLFRSKTATVIFGLDSLSSPKVAVMLELDILSMSKTETEMFGLNRAFSPKLRIC